jgi:type VI secretion system protein ImpL
LVRNPSVAWEVLDRDWWFTDEAVFLDTAGRYTTQQSHKDLDAGAWNGFLKLLKKVAAPPPHQRRIADDSVGDLPGIHR